MKTDNSSYTITNPDLFLTDDGISVLITSTNKDFVTALKLIVENHIEHSIVFNVQPSSTTETGVPWMWYVSRAVDIMFVDLDTCAWVDVCTALTKQQDDNHVVVFVSEKNKKRDAIKLINATSNYIILKSIKEIDAYMETHVQLMMPL
jgi:DNA-binding response OmpR family regulator